MRLGVNIALPRRITAAPRADRVRTKVSSSLVRILVAIKVSLSVDVIPSLYRVWGRPGNLYGYIKRTRLVILNTPGNA